jgi:hypothetical protein
LAKELVEFLGDQASIKTFSRLEKFKVKINEEIEGVDID